MSFISVAKFRIKQAIAGEKPRGLVKFLAPDLIVGFFVGVSSDETRPEYFPLRLSLVALGVALFTCLAETRRLFFSGGDLERFYFVQPTVSSRLGTASGVIFLNAAVNAAIFIPAIVASPLGREQPLQMVVWLLLTILASVSAYLVLLFFVAFLPHKAADRTLTVLQAVMALVLLAAFQLSARLDFALDPVRILPVSAGLFLVTSAVFSVFPFSENLISKLSENVSSAFADVFTIAERVKKLLLIRSDEEEAGFMFFIANLFRSSGLRLSTIGVAATPVMVAIFWSMQGARFTRFNSYLGFRDPNFIAPIASLTVSGVLIFYFLCQNIVSSRDHDAIWLFKSHRDFNTGQFVMGVRKGMLVTVHLPVTALIFLVSLFTNTFAGSLMTAITYYFLVHVAASWFSVMQKRFPFSVPFAQLAVTETANLVFMLAYSMVVSVALFLSYGSLGQFLLLNLFAFILVSIIEYSSVGIVNKRVKLGA